LIELLEEYKRDALVNAGLYVEGNIILGANPEQYEPPKPELLASETGIRIQKIVASYTPAQIEAVLDSAGIKVTEVTFRRISFYHVDVMGSGRFFYASDPEEVKVLHVR
jgi:hypothetical protein